MYKIFEIYLHTYIVFVLNPTHNSKNHTYVIMYCTVYTYIFIFVQYERKL